MWGARSDFYKSPTITSGDKIGDRIHKLLINTIQISIYTYSMDSSFNGDDNKHNSPITREQQNKIQYSSTKRIGQSQVNNKT